MESATQTEIPTLPFEAADLIFFNGALLTMVESQPTAEGIAVRNGLIQAVGTDEEVLAFEGVDTVTIDLQSHALMPGFIDGHTHILAFPDRMGKTLDDAQDVALRYGFTTVNEMWADEGFLSRLMQAEQTGDLRLRVNVFASYNDGILDDNHNKVILQTWFPEHDPILDPARFLRIPGVKIFVDGDNFTGRRGCWALSEPFEPGAPPLTNVPCSTARGDPYWSQDELNHVVAQAQAAGYRVAFHAMGDGAIDLALNAIEFALDGQPNANIRHQIEHNSLVRPDQLPRYEELDVLASVRGYGIAGCDPLTFLVPAFGAERMPWYVNRYVLAESNLHAYLETDFGWTVDPDNRFTQRALDPILQLYGLVTQRFLSQDGSSCDPDPLAGAHLVSIERALRMLTIEPAYAVSMEDYLGSLEPGKYADLIILSDSPLAVDPEEVKDLQVWMTMVAGKVEYCADGRAAFCQGVADAQTSPMDNTLPSGFHDATEGTQSPEGCLAAGWANDPDDPNFDLRVRILVDGAEITQTTADDFRPDLKTAGACSGGTCAFSVNLWGLITPNAEHSVLVQAQDAQTDEWVTLSETPKMLNCAG